MKLSAAIALASKAEDADPQGKLDAAWAATVNGAPLASIPAVAEFLARDERTLPELHELHEFVNWAVDYERDGEDHWQSVQETFERGAGDCEDIALACLALGRHLGLIGDCTIDVVRDNDSGELHAVLVVGEKIVLDNKSSRLVPLSAHRQAYTPIVRLTIDNTKGKKYE